jgi:hypothetical protein
MYVKTDMPRMAFGSCHSTGMQVQSIQRFVSKILLLKSVSLDLKHLAKPPTYHKGE